MSEDVHFEHWTPPHSTAVIGTCPRKECGRPVLYGQSRTIDEHGTYHLACWLLCFQERQEW